MTRQKETLGEKIRQAPLLLLFIPVLVLLMPLIVLALAVYFTNRALTYFLVWLLWIPHGKRVLVVYSDSPIWHDYFVNEIFPVVKERAVILNWSERKRWPKWSLATHVFRSFRGRHAYNPMVMVFRPFRSAECFQFWEPFKYWKRGNTWPVESMKRDLIDSLESYCTQSALTFTPGSLVFATLITTYFDTGVLLFSATLLIGTSTFASGK